MDEQQPFEEYEVQGVGTVIDPQGEPGYRVRLPDGQVTAFPAASGSAAPENAAADIAHALANPPPAPVPYVVSRFRFIVALRRVLGMTEGTVYAVLSQLPEETPAQIDLKETAKDAWENAREMLRDNPLLAVIAQAGGYTSQQIDDVFRAAKGYNDLD